LTVHTELLKEHSSHLSGGLVFQKPRFSLPGDDSVCPEEELMVS